MFMKRLATIGTIAVFIGIVVVVNKFEPRRVAEQRLNQEEDVSELIQEIEELEEQQTALLAGDPESAEIFSVQFDCSNGTFVVECYPEWSPLGAAQFKVAVKAGVYNEARFFRVLPDYIVQFGISGNPEVANEWEIKTILDEPVKQPNEKGTITFAKSSAPNSRTSQVFINLADNSQGLDSLGFSPFGKVISGMDVVEGINGEYAERPVPDMIRTRGNAYLKENFPNLGYIIRATVLSAEQSEDAKQTL